MQPESKSVPVHFCVSKYAFFVSLMAVYHEHIFEVPHPGMR